jgi:hypothetical protein
MLLLIMVKPWICLFMVTVAGTARSGTGIKVSLLVCNQALMGPSPLTSEFRPRD